MTHRSFMPFLCATFFILSNTIAFAENTDVVIFDNGDQLTGEFKTMSRGKLNMITHAADRIDVHWQKIAYLSIDRPIILETITGKRYSGNIARSKDASQVVVVTDAGPVTIESAEVATISTLDTGGLRDLTITVTAGYNFAKANSVQQSNVGLSVTHRTTKHISRGNFSTNTSNSNDNAASQRGYLIAGYSRLLPKRWLAGGTLSFDTNDELNISLRTSLGGGGGRILAEGAHSFFSLQGGLLLTRESLKDEPDPKDSVESYIDVQWDWFNFSRQELDWSTSLRVIPSLTEAGRVRGNLDTSFTWKIVGRLGWQLDLYGTFDSKPSTPGAEQTDYGINTSASYKF